MEQEIDTISVPGIVEIVKYVGSQSFRPDMYKQYEIPKSGGGRREINEPVEWLKILQQKIMRFLLAQRLPASPNACAYIYDKSIVDMAKPHIGKKVVIKMDLKDFFPKITPEMVVTALTQAWSFKGSRGLAPLPRSSKIVSLVREWCFLNNGLPIGAPTSPVLSNIVAYRMDRRIAGFINYWRGYSECAVRRVADLRVDKIAYTRYADDLCFSSNYEHLPEIIPIIRKIIEKSGFVVNEKKTRVMRKAPAIVGVSLTKLGKQTRYRRLLRQKLHQIAVNVEEGRVPKGMMFERNGKEEKIVPIQLASLRGQVAHIKFLNPQQGQKFDALLRRVENVC